MSCRLCLKSNNVDLLSILDDDIPMKIKSVTSLDIQVDKNFPMNLCIVCCAKLNELWAFRSMCLESDKILRDTQKSNLLTLYDKTDDIKLRNNQTKKYQSCSEVSENEIESLREQNCKFQFTFTESVYQCDICDNEFDQIIEYLDHQYKHNGNPVFKCDQCSSILSTRQELVAHEQNHETSCPMCKKTMKKSSLKLHLISHTDKFQCSQCLQTCSSRVALEQHKVTVHTDIKAYICENCGKKFSLASSLRSHLLTHSEERKYTCKFCDYAGRTASAIYIHMSKHSTDTCICSICSKVFKSNRHLNDHLRRVHSKVKKHVCAYCSRQFVDQYMLKVHLRIHTGLRPYTCGQCEKSFFRSDSLKEHMVVHQERISYVCEKCHKQYISKRSVSRHNCIAVKLYSI